MCDLKLCKDCKWCKLSWFDKLVLGFSAAQCHAPFNKMINVISGKETLRWKYCLVQRMHTKTTEDCDKEGKFFEPKE